MRGSSPRFLPPSLFLHHQLATFHFVILFFLWRVFLALSFCPAAALVALKHQFEMISLHQIAKQTAENQIPSFHIMGFLCPLWTSEFAIPPLCRRTHCIKKMFERWFYPTNGRRQLKICSAPIDVLFRERNGPPNFKVCHFQFFSVLVLLYRFGIPIAQSPPLRRRVYTKPSAPPSSVSWSLSNAPSSQTFFWNLPRDRIFFDFVPFHYWTVSPICFSICRSPIFIGWCCPIWKTRPQKNPQSTVRIKFGNGEHNLPSAIIHVVGHVMS